MANEFNTYEFVVDERAEGTRRLKKILGRGAMLAVVVVFVFACFAMNVPALAVFPLAMLGVVLYFWKLFNVELEYSMTSGNITFTRVYGGVRKKKVLDLAIKDMHEIAPVEQHTAEDLRRKGIVKSYMFASHSSAPDMYYAVFEQNGDKCVVYFEATQKALQILRYYNMVTKMSNVSR